MHDVSHYHKKADEYCAKAASMPDPGVKGALLAIAREYLRKARELTPRFGTGAGIE